jgi:hypothetical protein
MTKKVLVSLESLKGMTKEEARKALEPLITQALKEVGFKEPSEAKGEPKAEEPKDQEPKEAD